MDLEKLPLERLAKGLLPSLLAIEVQHPLTQHIHVDRLDIVETHARTQSVEAREVACDRLEIGTPIGIGDGIEAWPPWRHGAASRVPGRDHLAGFLGVIIGMYLEKWSHQRLQAEILRGVKRTPRSELRDILARNMRRLRAERGLSQERLAFEAGLNRTYVSAVERSEQNMSIDNIARVARALGVEAHILLMREMGTVG